MRKLGVGVLGVGEMGRRHAENLRRLVPHAQLVAVADVNAERARQTANELEIWYDGADEFAVRIDPPGYTGGRPVRLGERSDLLIAGRVVGRVYHRRHDPNNGDNHVVAFLDPVRAA